MNTKANYTSNTSSKKTYQAPKLKTLGHVKSLTLKIGSNTDTFGGHL